jgi:hypothetical protein
MMDRDTLRSRHADAIRRNWRAMDDRDGHVPDRLLDQLAVIADEHALDEHALGGRGSTTTAAYAGSGASASGGGVVRVVGGIGGSSAQSPTPADLSRLMGEWERADPNAFAAALRKLDRIENGTVAGTRRTRSRPDGPATA